MIRDVHPASGSRILDTNPQHCYVYYLIMPLEYHLLNYITEKTVPELIVNYFYIWQITEHRTSL